METINLFGAARGRFTQAAVWGMGLTRFSTQELASALAVSTPTAIHLLRCLEAHGLVCSCGEFGSTGGRKPKAWTPRPSARFAVGVDITQQHIGLVSVDLAGHMIRSSRHALPFSRTEPYFEVLAHCVDELCTGLRKENLLGIGLSIPGIVGAEEDIVVRSHALGIQNMRTDEFERYLKAPCRMINDANAGCLAEARSNESLRDAVYLSLSNSVGSALLIDRRLYIGHNLRSGEIGHTTLLPDGRPCYCGQKGCVDAYCRAGLLSDCTGGSLAAFFDALHKGNRALANRWNQYLDHVAITVNNLRMMLDCEVIIGGYVGMHLGEDLTLLRHRASLRNTFERDATYLNACTYQQEAAALGAAIPLIEAFLQALT